MEPENGHEIMEDPGPPACEGPSCPLEAENRAYYEGSLDYSYDLDADNKTPGGVGGAPIPFELEVVEAALQETTSQLYAKLDYCEKQCNQVSARLQSSINPAVLEELRLTKQSLVELDSRAGAIRQVLLDTLDDDDDIANLTISSAADTDEQKEDEEEEVENLIEYYLQQTETVHSTAEQLLENTRDLEAGPRPSRAHSLFTRTTHVFALNLRGSTEANTRLFHWLRTALKQTTS